MTSQNHLARHYRASGNNPRSSHGSAHTDYSALETEPAQYQRREHTRDSALSVLPGYCELSLDIGRLSRSTSRTSQASSNESSPNTTDSGVGATRSQSDVRSHFGSDDGKRGRSVDRNAAVPSLFPDSPLELTSALYTPQTAQTWQTAKPRHHRKKNPFRSLEGEVETIPLSTTSTDRLSPLSQTGQSGNQDSRFSLSAVAFTVLLTVLILVLPVVLPLLPPPPVELLFVPFLVLIILLVLAFRLQSFKLPPQTQPRNAEPVLFRKACP
eukprot:TRINITY_DN4227_c0_g1_i1.p1 TRINITY_DN4227_c0_g1~~TRINITY_DN4227_c0_g1_i1.p1  ORF type:complete len:269 (+),score=14.36 TRINITY_DN4227_c0_g1_i1:255-1061(+)